MAPKLSKSELAALDYLIALAEEENNPKLLTVAGATASWAAVAREIAKEVGRAAVAAGVAKAVDRIFGGRPSLAAADLEPDRDIAATLKSLGEAPTIEEIKAIRRQLS